MFFSSFSLLILYNFNKECKQIIKFDFLNSSVKSKFRNCLKFSWMTLFNNVGFMGWKDDRLQFSVGS